MRTSSLVAVTILAFASLGAIACAISAFARPFATRADLTQLVAGRLNGDAALASEVCGTPADGFMWPTPKLEELSYGEWPWAKVELHSWMPLFPRDGAATARVSGVGVDARQKPLTPLRSARVSFSYHCAWDDNGRSQNFVCTMPAPPVVTHE